jgi:RNA-directed DNA polymerase
LRERAEQVLGERPTWLVPLIRHVLKRLPQAPVDAAEHLSTVIGSAPAFRRVYTSGHRRPVLVRLVLGEAAMGESRWPVPPLPTTVDLAAWLAVTPSELDWFADVRGLNAHARRIALQHYSCQWLPKRSGGYRLLEAPKSRLKGLQRRVLREILERVPAHEAAHGFVRGRSALGCAQQHAGSAVVLRLDLEEFFPSIGAPRIFRTFRGLGYPEPVARALTGLCTVKVPSFVLSTLPAPSFAENLDAAALDARARTRRRLRHRHLPQGAPTSPALANLACFRLDLRLTGAARSLGTRYTRYADDLAFSGGAGVARDGERLQRLVAAIALEEGFRVNHHKTRLMTQGQSQRLLGLVTNQRAHVPRAARDRLEAILTNSMRHGLASQNRDGDPHFLESLRGRVAWVERVNPAHALKLRHLLNTLEAAASSR